MGFPVRQSHGKSQALKKEKEIHHEKRQTPSCLRPSFALCCLLKAPSVPTQTRGPRPALLSPEPTLPPPPTSTHTALPRPPWHAASLLLPFTSERPISTAPGSLPSKPAAQTSHGHWQVTQQPTESGRRSTREPGSSGRVPPTPGGRRACLPSSLA